MKKIFIALAGVFLTFHGISQDWLLTGNAGTNPATNYLGTKDNQRLVFRTDSTERMTILANGLIGMGLTAPVTILHVFSNNGATQASISGNNPAIQIFAGATANPFSLGRVAFATAAGAFTYTAVAGDFIVQNLDTVHSLLFGTGRDGTNCFERMRINNVGYVGIATTTPTAKLDVNCTAVTGQTNPSNIRFEHLPSGSGTVLVIDSNGYVFKSASGQTAVQTPLVTDMQSQVEELKNQVQELRNLLAARIPLTPAQAASLNAESTTWLGDIHPNPANSSATLEYSLPSGSSAAVCQVYSLDGKPITSIALPSASGKSQVQLNTSQLAAGMYIYALVVNGKVLDTKKLVIAR